jgi:hypothetical protein
VPRMALGTHILTTTMSNSGSAFEEEVAEALGYLLEDGCLGVDPGSAKLYRQKAYYSAQRKADIVFDIVIEVFRKDAAEPFLIWVWECKSYKNAVKASVVEAFNSKLQQIGSSRTKGTMIVRGKYQRSAIEFARSNGIGLARLVEQRPRFVLECTIRSEPYEPTQADFEAGLVAGLRAHIGADAYGVTTSGIYVDDLETFIRLEAQADSRFSNV